MSTASILDTLQQFANPEKAKILQRFFKTGKGEYGEGDKFLGVVVPDTRKIAKQFKGMALNDVETLLRNERHEARMCALLILVEQMKQPTLQKQIVNIYLRNTTYINNRDLVDLTAPEIVGRHYFDKDRSKLYELASSSSLREKRIAVLATYYFIKQGQHEDTLKLAELLLHDNHDLMHKAI